jgi:hypothetical protein
MGRHLGQQGLPLITDFMFLPRGSQPNDCRLLLKNLPNGVTCRYNNGKVYLHDAEKHMHSVCELGDLNYVTLRAMLDALGHADHKAWCMSAGDAVAGRA